MPGDWVSCCSLKGDTDAQVISRHQRRSIDGTPYSMQTTYYSMKFVTDKGSHAPPGGQGHCRRSGRLSPRPRHRSGGLARPVLRAATGRKRTGLLQSVRPGAGGYARRAGGPDTTRRAIPISVTVTVYPGDPKRAPNGSRRGSTNTPFSRRLAQHRREPAADWVEETSQPLRNRVVTSITRFGGSRV